MNILVIGSGGREHAIVWKLSQSQSVTKIYCAPGNAGIGTIAENVPIKADDITGLLTFAWENAIDLTVVGPENPLVAGIVDTFEAHELKILGPKKYAAQLEGSKSFAKDFMRAHGIPTAGYQTFTRGQIEQARKHIDDATLPIVVKADGLAAGKGVLICETKDEANTAIDNVFANNIFGSAGDTVVIEEYMYGEEASVFALCDGERYVTLSSAQDYKRIGEGDTGKNTGGMGAFAPARIIDETVLARVKTEIIDRVIMGMQVEGCPYTGFLYCGLMMTEAGPKVVEFNCRMGDPEAQVTLPLLDCDFAAVCMQTAEKRLDVDAAPQRNANAVCVVLASAGYPDSYPVEKEIFGLDKFGAHGNVVIFHAGTKKMDGKIVTAGGRVLGVTAIGEGQSLHETITDAYKAVGNISFEGMYYRGDIGTKGLRH